MNTTDTAARIVRARTCRQRAWRRCSAMSDQRSADAGSPASGSEPGGALHLSGKFDVRKTIRLVPQISVDGDWPGDDRACEAVLQHVPSGIVEVDHRSVLLIEAMTAEVVDAATTN